MVFSLPKQAPYIVNRNSATDIAQSTTSSSFIKICAEVFKKNNLITK